VRIIALPTVWDEAEGLLPIDVQDIDLIVSPEELDSLADFFARAARTFRETGMTDASMDFGDSKLNPQTGIWINVKVPRT
jgi:hypothetical protein